MPCITAPWPWPGSIYSWAAILCPRTVFRGSSACSDRASQRPVLAVRPGYLYVQSTGARWRGHSPSFAKIAIFLVPAFAEDYRCSRLVISLDGELVHAKRYLPFDPSMQHMSSPISTHTKDLPSRWPPLYLGARRSTVIASAVTAAAAAAISTPPSSLPAFSFSFTHHPPPVIRLGRGTASGKNETPGGACVDFSAPPRPVSEKFFSLYDRRRRHML